MTLNYIKQSIFKKTSAIQKLSVNLANIIWFSDCGKTETSYFVQKLIAILTYHISAGLHFCSIRRQTMNFVTSSAVIQA